MTRVKVLIAAREAAVSDELAARVESAGYQAVAQAYSVNESIALAESRHPNLVLMETHLGGIGEITEALERIQTDGGIPVVFVADTDNDLPIMSHNSDLPYGFLVQPFGHQLFKQVVEAAVYRHSLEQGNRGSDGRKRIYSGPEERKVAHDINNSLSSALANIQLARRSSLYEEDFCRRLDDAEKSVLRARDQSHQLLMRSEGPEKIAGAIQEVQVPKMAPHRTANRKEGTAATGCRILLMDDEDAILSATSDMLSFLGHKVTTAKSGDEAIEFYRKAQSEALPFDAVILDITVPGGIGAEEALPLLREIDPEVRAIISSGYATHPLLISFATSGFAAALIKPYGFKELEESIAQASDHKRL